MSLSTQDLIVFFCSFGVACFALNIYKLTQPAKDWAVDIPASSKAFVALLKRQGLVHRFPAVQAAHRWNWALPVGSPPKGVCRWCGRSNQQLQHGYTAWTFRSTPQQSTFPRCGVLHRQFLRLAGCSAQHIGPMRWPCLIFTIWSVSSKICVTLVLACVCALRRIISFAHFYAHTKLHLASNPLQQKGYKQKICSLRRNTEADELSQIEMSN